MPNSRTHHDLSRLLVRLVLVLAVCASGLLAHAAPASASECVYLYRNGVGTTVCTP